MEQGNERRKLKKKKTKKMRGKKKFADTLK